MLLELPQTQTQDARPMPIAAQRQYVKQIKAVRDAARN